MSAESVACPREDIIKLISSNPAAAMIEAKKCGVDLYELIDNYHEGTTRAIAHVLVRRSCTPPRIGLKS